MPNRYGAEVEAVVQVLQTSLAPVFLLAALSTLLSVLTTRIARVVDRTRAMMNEHHEPEMNRAELANLIRRGQLLRAAMILAVSAGVTICAIISMLFVMGLTSYSNAVGVFLLFIAAMLMLSGALVSLLLEIEYARRQLARLHQEIADRLEIGKVG